MSAEPPVDLDAVGGRSVRVVLVDDHRMFRTGVRAELGEPLQVVGEADDAPTAVEVVERLRPDVVLLDVHLPGGGGVAVLRALVARLPETRFLALSVSDAPEDVISVIRAGARGYVTKSITGPELTDAVVRVADGDAVFGPRLAGFVLDAFSAGGTTAAEPAEGAHEDLDRLTQREREVLQGLAEGLSDKEIGQRLYISGDTVRNHMARILSKLGVESRLQALVFALRHGVARLD